MRTVLLRNGNDLIASISVRDSQDNGIIAGVVVKFTVQRISDGKWYNSGTNAFDLGAEPAGDNAPHVLAGLYELVLTGGSSSTEEGYRVHIITTGAVATNFAISENILADSASSAVLVNSDQNKEVIARAIREYDASGINGGVPTADSIEGSLVDQFDALAVLNNSNKAEIISEIDANQIDIGDLATDIGLIKAKTDNLPVDPTSETSATTNMASIISEINDNEVLIDANKDILDRLNSMIEDVGGWRFTLHALEEVPGGDATLAMQNTIFAAMAKDATVALDATVAKEVTLDLIDDKIDNIPLNVDSLLTITHGVGSWQQGAVPPGLTASDKSYIADMIITREVTGRHLNGKPSSYLAGSGVNQVNVNTTINGQGFTNTEVIV